MNIKTEQRLVASRIKRFHLRLFLNISFVFWTHSLKTVYNVKVTQYHWPISRHFYKGNDLCDFRFAFLHPPPPPPKKKKKKFGLWGGYRGEARWMGMGVGCLMHLVDFCHCSERGQLLWLLVRIPAYQAASEKVFALKEKNLPPTRSKFFPF